MNENDTSNASSAASTTPVEQPRSLEDKITDHLFRGEMDDSPASQSQDTDVNDSIEQTAEQSTENSAQFDTVDYEGKTYQVPAEIKDALLRQSDYTRKTQEVAEIRKAAELKVKAMTEAEAFGKSIQGEVATIQSIDSQLSQYKTLDWEKLTAEQMYLAKHNMDVLKEKKAELQETLKGKQEEFKKGREYKRQEMIGETVKYLGTQNKGWTDKNGEDLTNYVTKGLGYPQETALNIFTDPVLTNALWKAKQWDNLQAQKGDITKKINSAPPVIKPGSSNPEMSAKAKDAQLTKQIKSAKTDAEKAALIRQRLESRFFKDM